MLPVNLRSFKAKVKKDKRKLKLFLSRVEKTPPKNLQKMAEEIDKEVWQEVDCLSCANCCKTMSPTYTKDDMHRISHHLHMTVDAFKEKYLYLEKKDKDWMNTKQPCQFLNLKDNKCSIYAVRPLDCATFPHLTKKKWTEYVHVHKQNIEYCPATFRMVEKMKERMEQKN